MNARDIVHMPSSFGEGGTLESVQEEGVLLALFGVLTGSVKGRGTSVLSGGQPQSCPRGYSPVLYGGNPSPGIVGDVVVHYGKPPCGQTNKLKTLPSPNHYIL